jgi:hypothetical protein
VTAKRYRVQIMACDGIPEHTLYAVWDTTLRHEVGWFSHDRKQVAQWARERNAGTYVPMNERRTVEAPQ